jgi:23S rRNA pseudouridine2605 synthase
MRLQKWLARAGLCSRREGERWIEAGRVAINGTLITRLGTQVQPGDSVTLDGAPVEGPIEGRLVLAFNKPRGVLCSRSDPKGRPLLYDHLPTLPVRVNSIGRLDYLSEGLLLLTNDGLLAHRLSHPRQQVPRTYRIKVHGRITDALLEKIRQGVTLDDGPTGPLTVTDLRYEGGGNTWVNITLREGRNRMLRRLFALFEMDVARLVRLSYGGITLGQVPKGEGRLLKTEEVDHLRRVAGLIRPQPSPPGNTPQRRRPPSRKRPATHKPSGPQPKR